MIPKDVMPSGNGTNGWVDCIFYGKTTEEVLDKKHKYFAEYPPQGYDTHSVSPMIKHRNYFHIEVRRWSTCE